MHTVVSEYSQSLPSIVSLPVLETSLCKPLPIFMCFVIVVLYPEKLETQQKHTERNIPAHTEFAFWTT